MDAKWWFKNVRGEVLQDQITRDKMDFTQMIYELIDQKHHFSLKVEESKSLCIWMSVSLDLELRWIWHLEVYSVPKTQFLNLDVHSFVGIITCNNYHPQAKRNSFLSTIQVNVKFLSYAFPNWWDCIVWDQSPFLCCCSLTNVVDLATLMTIPLLFSFNLISSDEYQLKIRTLDRNDLFSFTVSIILV